jgi:propanediol dehydratase small subunit
LTRDELRIERDCVCVQISLAKDRGHPTIALEQQLASLEAALADVSREAPILPVRRSARRKEA